MGERKGSCWSQQNSGTLSDARQDIGDPTQSVVFPYPPPIESQQRGSLTLRVQVPHEPSQEDL